jgi:hypothetical protein
LSFRLATATDAVEIKQCIDSLIVYCATDCVEVLEQIRQCCKEDYSEIQRLHDELLREFMAACELKLAQQEADLGQANKLLMELERYR